jgi:hypothetical protein
MNKVTVDIHVKRKPGKNDSMFYFGEHIATIKKGEKTFYVESAGEMKAYFSEKGDCYQNEQLAKELEARKITDRTLSRLGEKDQILMNNWFRISDDNGNEISIAHTHSGAIHNAKELIK